MNPRGPASANASVAALAGALFGMGLTLSGMTRPEKVLAFLDLAGAWDPSLLFVMGGAVVVHFGLYRLVRRRPRPLFDDVFHVSVAKQLDARLIGGAALFGVGWGLGGFCPGPALVTAASGSATALVFVVAMALGLVAARTWTRRPTDEPDRTTAATRPPS